MVGGLQRLEKLCENGRGFVQMNLGKEWGQQDERLFLDWRRKDSKHRGIRKGRRTKWKKERSTGFGIPLGAIKWEFRFWETQIWLWTGWMGNGRSTIKNSGWWYKRRRACWTRLTSGRWGITWTCISTLTEIGIRKLINSHTWQEKKGRLGTPTSPKQELGLRQWGVSLMAVSAVLVMTRSKTEWDRLMWFKLRKNGGRHTQDEVDDNHWGCKFFLDNATVTQAECTAAVEAARGICCLDRSGSICFDLDGNLIEDSSRNTTKKRKNLKDDIEGRWRMEEEEISRLSRSLSSSVHMDIFDSGSVEEMSQKHYKLGAKPKWSAHADWPNLSEDSFTTPIPPSRDKSLWRITTTKTVEGLMSEQPSRGVNQKIRGPLWSLVKKAYHGVRKADKRIWRNGTTFRKRK